MKKIFLATLSLLFANFANFANAETAVQESAAAVENKEAAPVAVEAAPAAVEAAPAAVEAAPAAVEAAPAAVEAAPAAVKCLADIVKTDEILNYLNAVTHKIDSQTSKFIYESTSDLIKALKEKNIDIVSNLLVKGNDAIAQDLRAVLGNTLNATDPIFVETLENYQKGKNITPESWKKKMLDQKEDQSKEKQASLLFVITFKTEGNSVTAAFSTLDPNDLKEYKDILQLQETLKPIEEKVKQAKKLIEETEAESKFLKEAKTINAEIETNEEILKNVDPKKVKTINDKKASLQTEIEAFKKTLTEDLAAAKAEVEKKDTEKKDADAATKGKKSTALKNAQKAAAEATTALTESQNKLKGLEAKEKELSEKESALKACDEELTGLLSDEQKAASEKIEKLKIKKAELEKNDDYKFEFKNFNKTEEKLNAAIKAGTDIIEQSAPSSATEAAQA